MTNIYSISQTLEAGTSRIEMPAGLVSGGDSLPGLQTALCPHSTKTEEALVSFSLIPSRGLYRHGFISTQSPNIILFRVRMVAAALFPAFLTIHFSQ